VKKPLLGREGKGVKVFRNRVEEPSEKGNEGEAESGASVHQTLAQLAEVDGTFAVIGSWLVDWEPCGMGIRESKGLVTTNTSRFVPRLFR
jgi:glutathionylspermidine synthase